MKLSNPEFGKPTYLIERQDELAAAVKDLRAAPECAVDTESNSLYAYQEQVCLIQVSTASKNYIFDPIMLGSLDSFGEITADRKIRKYIHGADYDIGSMKRDFKYEFRNVFDTMIAARMLSMPEIGLAALVKRFMNVALDKKYRKSNWTERPIPPARLVYLVKDVEYLIDVGRRLDELLVEAGLTDKANQQFAAVARRQPITPVHEHVSMWKVKGVSALDRKNLPVFFKLFQWREREARRRNVPVFVVMSSKTLLDIARMPWDKNADIRGIPGVTELVYRRYGEAVLRAIREGRALPPNRVPPPRKSKGQR